MHTYILIFLLSLVRGGRVPRRRRRRLSSLSGVDEQQMHLREELIQKCISARELFTYRCMIMIPRLIRDKSCRLSGAVEVTCFFPADLYLDSGLISQLIPWCLLTPEWCFPFFSPLLSLRYCHAGSLWDSAQGSTRPTFVLPVAATVLDSTTKCTEFSLCGSACCKNAAAVSTLR